MAVKSLVRGYSDEFKMPMVQFQMPLDLLGTSGNLVLDVMSFAEEIQAITHDGLVCANIPVKGYGEALYHETGLDDALCELMEKNGLC